MKKYLTEDQMAESLGVSKMAVWRYRREGMPYIRLSGRTLRFDPDDVDVWLKSRGTSEPMRSPPPGRKARVEQVEKM